MKTKFLALFSVATLLLTMCTTNRPKNGEKSQVESCAKQLKSYAQQKGYSTKYCLLIDMSINSGLKRFFVYDLTKNTVAFSGLVAHGSCDQLFLSEVRFSNTPESGCTSYGVFKVGGKYRGHYGKAYKLYGLQTAGECKIACQYLITNHMQFLCRSSSADAYQTITGNGHDITGGRTVQKVQLSR